MKALLFLLIVLLNTSFALAQDTTSMPCPNRNGDLETDIRDLSGEILLLREGRGSMNFLAVILDVLRGNLPCFYELQEEEGTLKIIAENPHLIDLPSDKWQLEDDNTLVIDKSDCDGEGDSLSFGGRTFFNAEACVGEGVQCGGEQIPEGVDCDSHLEDWGPELDGALLNGSEPNPIVTPGGCSQSSYIRNTPWVSQLLPNLNLSWSNNMCCGPAVLTSVRGALLQTDVNESELMSMIDQMDSQLDNWSKNGYNCSGSSTTQITNLISNTNIFSGASMEISSVSFCDLLSKLNENTVIVVHVDSQGRNNSNVFSQNGTSHWAILDGCDEDTCFITDPGRGNSSQGYHKAYTRESVEESFINRGQLALVFKKLALDQACTTPWGSSVSHSSSVIAYESESVGFGSRCSQQTRTCNNGSLSGGYRYESCTEDEPRSCTTPWGSSVSHGSSIVAWNRRSSTNCLSQRRTCNNGELSGSYIQRTCSSLPIVVDNGDSTTSRYSISAGGVGGYWWTVSTRTGFNTTAYGGSVQYTFGGTYEDYSYTWESINNLNGRYKVEFHRVNPPSFDPNPQGYPDSWIDCTSVKARIVHDNSSSTGEIKYINMSGSNGWVHIGDFDVTGKKIKIVFTDHASPTWCAVGMDAVRFTKKL